LSPKLLSQPEFWATVPSFDHYQWNNKHVSDQRSQATVPEENMKQNGITEQGRSHTHGPVGRLSRDGEELVVGQDLADFGGPQPALLSLLQHLREVCRSSTRLS